MVNFAYYYSLLFRYHFLIESKVLSTFPTCQSYLVCMCFMIMNTKTYFQAQNKNIEIVFAQI